MPDGADYTIKEIRQKLLMLDGYLIKELDQQQQRQAAGWLVEEIEAKLAQLEQMCQKTKKIGNNENNYGQ